MGFWRRSQQHRSHDQSTGVGAAEEHADALAERADELAMSAPGTGPAIEAAERSAAAAEQLLAATDSVANQRRLARARWRRTSAHLMAGDVWTAASSARECWTVCLQLLDATAADATAFDEVAGLIVWWCGALGPTLAMAGLQEEADRMQDVCIDIAARAQGPRGRQARARQTMAGLMLYANVFKQADLDGRGDQIEDALHHAIPVARHAVEILREHASEGPYDTADLAVMLRTLSRLYTVAGRWEDAVAALDDAISVALTVADRGPTFAGVLQELRDERGDRPAAASQRAFQRAAADVGYVEQFPEDIVRAAAAVERLGSQQVYDVDRHGPRHGLAMAWHAHLMAGIGQPAQARDLAAEAVRQLTRFSDNPERIQAALVVALTVQATAARATGHHDEARLAEQRAANVLALLTARDDTYAGDLHSS